ncbi:hypothetical protein GYMLUDRAFT_165314 [Collybiopsis luxurians FD-317 M1]|uniref:ferric-chelate reductase (NADPH) n=1 Tax=Collybiopsis luxurians FD-317 M1 TaxID=944289 RepID=A0A0D0CZ86_9AGAR|nr:hypothetical protein GYMLUDRAFT_165314 [Collybiopsis luxurians FD-317 M1]
MSLEEFQLIHMKWHNVGISLFLRTATYPLSMTKWYTADWDYGQTTVAFFGTAIGCAALLLAASQPSKVHRTGLIDKLFALARYTVSRRYRISFLRWHSPPLASILARLILFILRLLDAYIEKLTLAAKPYYWPNMNMGHSQPIVTRTGWISMAIMPFMIVFATKVNFVGLLTQTSHEKLQVFHRWSATFMYITSLVHTFPFIVKSIEWGTMEVDWNTSQSYWTGVAALVPQTYLVFTSWGFFRNRYYEFFKNSATIFMIALFVHVDWINTSWDYFWGTIAAFFTAHFFRVFRTWYNSTLFGLPTSVEALSDRTIKLTVLIPAAKIKWTPGQHVFIRFLSLGIHAFSSHPFTITSIGSLSGSNAGDMVPVEFILRVRSGITEKLARTARAAKGEMDVGKVWVDGPYGGVPVALSGFDHVYLFAGGSGMSIYFLQH